MRYRRLAMDEFGSAFRRVSELRGRKRMDPTAASLPCFQNRHPFGRPRELSRCDQARGSGTNDDDILCLRSSHAGLYRPVALESAFWIRYRSNIAPPSSASLLSSVIVVMGAR